MFLTVSVRVISICFMQEINSFRGHCGSLFNFDWITVPLVYTQVSVLMNIFVLISYKNRCECMTN